MSFYDEFKIALETINHPPQGIQTREEYLVGVLTAIGKEIDDKTWDKLSAGAQHWYLKAADACNSDLPIPSLPGFDQMNGETTEVKPVHITNNGTSAKAVTPAKKERPPKSNSSLTRQIVIQHMDWSNEQIKAELLRVGVDEMSLKISSISTVRTDSLATLKEALELGWKKP